MKTVEEFVADLPANERPILETLRQIILETLPEVREKLSYGVPYFYRKSRICFLWPASSPLAGRYEGVMLGFCRGHLLSNEQGLLDLGSRKEVSTVIFSDVRSIPQETVREVLLEAAMVDELA